MDTDSDPIPILEDLVRIPSHETVAELAGHLAGRLDGLRGAGVRVTVSDVPGAPGQCNVRAVFGEGEPSLILNSHMDTVPPGPGWLTDPFVPTRSGDRVTALGAVDAKGCLAAMFVAFRSVATSLRPGAGRLIFSAVALEETAGRGSEIEVTEGPRAGAVVVGEPTDLDVCVAHKGILRLRVTVLGKAAHASEPWVGQNAITAMQPVIREIERLAVRLSARTEDPVGPASLAITTVEGGTAINVIPARCSITLDRRLLPGENVSDARAEIEATVREALLVGGVQGRVEPISVADAAATPRDAPIVRTALDAVAAAGGSLRPRGFGACCDMYLFAGKGGMPCVILGPGSLGQAHHADEAVPMGAVRRAARVYTDLARRWLGAGRS